MRVCLQTLFVMTMAVVAAACGGESSRPGTTPPPAASTAPGSPTTTSAAEFGAAECDAYVKSYLACLDRMPADARDQARQALEQTRASWKQAAATEQGRAALAMTCKAASDAAAAAMRAYGCSW